MHAQVSALERFYRFFWKNKGDIYHLTWDLTRYAMAWGQGMPVCKQRTCTLPDAFHEPCTELYTMHCRFLDGRVWPKEDEKQVNLMMAMIHHCTGGLCATCCKL